MRKLLTGRRHSSIWAGIAALSLPGTLLAHHPMEGTVPTNIWHGFLSGLGHPVIGVDHFAFLVALGVLAGLVKHSGMTMILAFVPATAIGTLLLVSGVGLGAAEVAIALSLFLVGLALVMGWTRTPLLFAGIASLAGIFHGYGYGEAIVGSEPMPLIAYLAGLVVIQTGIALAVAHIVRRVKAPNDTHVPNALRYGGAAVGVLGVIFAGQAILF